MGGIIPESDVGALDALGVKAVFTPKDFDLMDVMDRILDVIGAPRGETTALIASAEDGRPGGGGDGMMVEMVNAPRTADETGIRRKVLEELTLEMMYVMGEMSLHDL